MAYPTTSTVPAVSTPTESSFKGHPVLTLPNPGDPTKPGIQMGIKKLKAILSNLSAVEAFVKKHDKPAAPAGVNLAAVVAALKAKGIELTTSQVEAMLK